VNTRYPWYDSVWLSQYVGAKELIQRTRPALLSSFVHALACLKTRPDFQVKEVSRVFDDDVMQKIRERVKDIQADRWKTHEIPEFGRFVVHNDPFLTQLHQSIIDFVSAAVGEPVEASYNFLSIYTRLGVCPVHMDSPQAKWTLDLCIDQSEPWPIQISQVLPWPEDFTLQSENWDESIRGAAHLQFTSYALQPGHSLVFSGSSQWHYRDGLPKDGKDHFCRLIFFHFVPKGMCETIEPRNWPNIFGIPELANIVSVHNPTG